MKCELCHERQAETVLYRQSENGKREELYVCHACAARERAFGESRGIQVTAIDAGESGGESPMGELFGRIGKLLEGLPGQEAERETRCPGCGTTMDEIRTVGLIGCPVCYKTFGKALRALFDECQLCHQYAGDALPGEAQATTVQELERQLAEALKREDYREAKRLRAELKRLRDEEDGHGE